MKKVFKTMAFTLLGLVLSSNVMADSYELYTGSTIAEGDYIIVGYQSSSQKYYAMNNTCTSSQYLGITEVSPSKDAITVTGTDIVWSIAKSTNGYYIKNSSNYLDDNATDKKNYVNLVSTPATTSEWSISYNNTNKLWQITNYGTTTNKKTLSFNISSTRVACYASVQSGNTCHYLYKKSSTPAGKDVSIDADEELNLTCEESDGTITVTYGEDVADKDIYLYNDAECTSSFTGDWFTADFDASGNVEYVADANTGAAREVYIQIYVIADDTETDNTKVIKVTQAKYSAPTGTFNKFTGDNLKEGDYVICSSTDAMNNTTISGPRIGYQTITVSNNNIENPDEAVIWHIAPAATDGYWTIYNEAEEKYAAFTSGDGKGTLLDEVTDYALWQYSTVSSNKEFSNKGKASKYLRKNGTYGFASYGTGTGSALTLYKKYVEPAKNKVTLDTEIEHGTISATPASGTLESVEEDVVVTLTNTPADDYKLDAYDVYKTDESTTKVSVKDGKFTMPAYPVTVSATFSLSIETPVLSEVAGDKNDAINVKVTNYNGDYSYYYTLDGIDPTNASTPYVDADGIDIDASCTLKVIAYKGDVTSPVASATYNLPLMTMDAIFAAATTAGKTATDVRVKFTNCVVTGVKNNNAYLTDNDGKGLIIFQSSHGFEVNDKLNGAVNVKVQLYNGSAEITTLTSSTSGLAVTKDGSVSPITTIGIADLSGVNTGAVLSYENLTYDGEYFSDGTNGIKPYNNFNIEDYPTFENGDKYNVTGVYIQFNSTKEIAPRSLDDLEKIEATKYAINIDPSIENGSISTDPETEAADGIKVTLSATPETGYMLSAWSVVDAESNLVEVINNQFTMPAMAVTVSATFVELPIWATTYTSNVTLSGNKVKLAEEYQPADYPEDGYDAKKDGSSGAKASISVKVPANTTGLHYHLFAWNGEGGKTVSIKKGETVLATFTNIADEGISGSSSTYTLQNNPVDAYGYVALEGITEETTITFSTPANSNRICLFGVNAIQPASITIAPAEKNFGEVKQGFDAEQVFSLTPNAFATGTITAEIDGDDVFTASTVEDNEVTVTFAPTEITDYSATLIIKHDGTQMCTATLTGKGISAETPEILVSDEEIDFGKEKQDASIADKTVTVTLNYLDAATASISEGAFTIDKTDLVAGENTITISATASSMGEKNATITITGEGATTKTIAVKMDVTSKYASEYNSNVEVGNDKVIIAKEEYEAVKKGTGSKSESTTITVPEKTQTLHFHAAAWNNENTILVVKQGETTLGSFNLYKDAGVKNNSPFTLSGNNYDTDQYFYVNVSDYTADGEAEITFTTTESPYRFVLYGVNQEGGLTKQLSSIEVSGTPNKLQYTEGNTFDPTGLTVMGTFKFGEETLSDREDVTAQVTEWVVDPATLASTTTSVSVVAKVGEIASEEYIVENVRVLPENTDIINASTGTATTSTYKEFTATGLTNTKYAGKTALNDGNLTLSNAASHPGIVSTYTIGYIKSVKVTIADDNTHNLDVYGSHRAYQSAEDLYSLKNAIRGTKIGTLTASGVLDLSEAETKYEFIGIRSEEGAIQVPEIQITWTPVEFLRISVAENIEGGTIDIDRTVATAEEVGNVQVTIEPTPNEGLQFDKLVIYNESDEDVTASITIAESGLSFTMPNYNVKVGATFKSQPVTAISLDKSAITVDKNNTETLTASFLPQGAFTEVTWTSANEAIAMVDEEGVVTGMGQGTTTITASCNDGALTATCTVTVNAQPEYVLVTDATSLQDGDVIVLGSAANNAANGGYISDKKYLDKVEATITDNVLTSNELMEITLCKTDAGWNLVTEQGHLGAKAAKNLLINDVYTDWTISISGNVATISAGDPGRFLYNVNSPRFLNYTSDISTTMLLPEIYRLSNDTKKVVKLMDKNNVYAIYRVREGENVTLSVALPSGCTKGWTMDGETYAQGATIENVTDDMVLYAIQSEDIINEDKEISSKDVNKGSTITIGDGTTATNVTITSETQETAQAYQIVVKKNATVTISTPSDISNLEVEVGGKVTVETTKKLTVNNFVIKSTMAGGESGQVMGVTTENFVVEGEAYYDVVMDKCAEGKTIADQWHAFAVPFNVDAINGVYDENDNKLTNEVNYAIMDYHGDVRAEGKYGWKKFRGIMTPGTFYLMTVDGARTTYRMKMNGGFHASSTTITVNEYASGTDTDAGWNGIANNQLGYSSVGVNVQVLNPTSYTYETMTASEYNFTVGTPFFYQADATGTIDLTAPNASENYAPRRVGAAEAKNIAVTLGNDKYIDRLYISATDEATNEYQIGRDLVKMTMTNTPTVPQIFAEAYGTKLSMIDVPMMNDEAVYALNLYAPANGEYTIGAAQVEGYEVFLTQYGSVIWNLSMSEATIELTKGNNTEYGLILKATSGHAPTNINTLNGQESVQKFLYNSNIYIRHNNKTFNVQGQLVK